MSGSTGRRRTDASIKSEMLTVRVRPDIKDALRDAAEREHRSMANMLEVMIRDWCERLPADRAGMRTSSGASSQGDAND